MLPGFRFLFAAIVLSMSVLVFGLGAAALLRAAHEQFASMPSRRAPPQPVFAQPSEPVVPTLALLRVEPATAEKAPDVAEKAPDIAGKAPDVVVVPAEPAADTAPTAEPEKMAALKPEDAPSPEAVKPEMPTIEAAPASLPAQAEAPARPDEPKLAAISETPPPASEVASTPAEPVAEAPPPAASIAATKIATLGGPAVTIEDTASAKAHAKPERRAAAKRTKERRRIARRARPAPPQAAADPFAQPTMTVRSR